MASPANTERKAVLRMLKAAYKLAAMDRNYAQMAEIAMRIHYVQQDPAPAA